MIVMHTFGDALSPIVIGAILDRTNNNWTIAMLTISLAMIPGLILWFIAWRLAVRNLTIQPNETHLLNATEHEMSEM